MSRAVAQWLVRAIDHRVGTGTNPVSDSVTVAASKLGVLGKFVYHTSRTSRPVKSHGISVSLQKWDMVSRSHGHVTKSHGI